MHSLLYRKLYKHPLIQRYLGECDSDIAKDCIGWGYKPSGLSAIKNAVKKDSDLLLFEDAPVRSMLPGYKGAIFGISVDTRGAMFDSSGKSDLLRALKYPVTLEKETTELLEKFRSKGISKYNGFHPTDISNYAQGVLLVDQTRGDASHKFGGLKNDTFNQLFEDALRENSECPIYIKTHPDSFHKNKKSCFSSIQLSHPRVKILPHTLSPAQCFSFCSTVYVGTSLLGMEALIHGVKVISYGWNFYAGWGLTEDRGVPLKDERLQRHSLAELFQAAYINYSHYYHPDTLSPCSLSEIIDYIISQWEQWSKGAGHWFATCLSPWKKQLLPAYLGPRATISHLKSDESSNHKILTWGSKTISKELKNLPVVRVEDGFIRSRGLGANFNFPLSWVFDDVGIYFDARSPSRLENLLEKYEFCSSELEQTEELLDFLRANKLTKYNLGIKEVSLPAESQGKRVILIPGQVDSDASIEFGSPKIRNNRELLTEIRSQHPEAYICYKPHPDLLSGARRDAPLWDGIENDADYLVTEGDIISWIQAVDEVHTLTSTVGFEALIHGKPVFTYGLPFYAGWGLTTDWLSCERRTASRTLLELACATLILYPTYLNPKTGEFTTALNAAKLLSDPEFIYDSRSGFLKALGKLKSWYYKLRR